MDEMLEKVRQQFAHDRFATENGMVIDEIGDNYARCSVVLTDRHKNAMGGVMGGVHFTLADFAFAAASNWKEMKTVALSTDISFIGAVKGSKLTAEAFIVKDGKNINCCHITVKDDLGNMVADVKTVGFHK